MPGADIHGGLQLRQPDELEPLELEFDDPDGDFADGFHARADTLAEPEFDLSD